MVSKKKAYSMPYSIILRLLHCVIYKNVKYVTFHENLGKLNDGPLICLFCFITSFNSLSFVDL